MKRVIHMQLYKLLNFGVKSYNIELLNVIFQNKKIIVIMIYFESPVYRAGKLTIMIVKIIVLYLFKNFLKAIRYSTNIVIR